MKENKLSNISAEVVEIDGKLYIATAITASQVLSQNDVRSMQIDPRSLALALKFRLSACMKRLQYAVENNAVVELDYCDSSAVYYRKGDGSIGRYSLNAANSMKSAVKKLEAMMKINSTVDGLWLVENLSTLEIQQAIKAVEEVAEEYGKESRNVLEFDTRDLLDALHEALAVAWEKPKGLV